MQKLGQHFLKNERALKKIVEAVNPESGDTIVEVGPGHGELTIPLAQASEKCGCTILAVEKDAVLAETLERKLRELGVGNVQIMRDDIRALLQSQFLTSKIKAPWILVGNIPYYLTGYLLRLVGDLPNKPKRSVFTIQKEVAERLSASPPHMNKLSASLQYWTEPSILGIVSKNDFYPKPRVDSAIVLLKTKRVREAEHARYAKAVRTIFQQPRKTIANNLIAGVKIPSRKKISATLKHLSIEPNLRPGNLSVREIESIAEQLFSSPDGQGG